MKFSSLLITSLFLQSQVLALTIKKRASTTASTTTLTESVWTGTSSASTLTITPYAFDGVTVSASPAVENTTPWVSLDSSGVPSGVTATVKGSSTKSASATPTNANYPTNYIAAPPVLGCFNERVSSGNAFCISNGTEWVLDETYWITWNPLYWSESDVVTKSKIMIRAYNADNDTDALLTSDWIKSAQNFYAFTVTQDYIDSSSNGYVQLFVAPFTDDDSTVSSDTVDGPVIKLLSSKSDASSKISRLPSDNADGGSSSSSHHSKAKVIAPAVVVPVVVIGLIAGGLVVYFFYRQKKNGGKSPFSSSRGSSDDDNTRDIEMKKRESSKSTKSEGINTYHANDSMAQSVGTNPFK
ncbi:unnamed protein product [Ambrosiozyma monospora]|uniref:Unnamed protein product n=1 Tax=Ambrosiozyma monospora TaxID=43982 RepID=A0ACB5SXM3_AMBMO|nr:unnamed protein product [Ambrosiozyma monospora]